MHKFLNFNIQDYYTWDQSFSVMEQTMPSPIFVSWTYNPNMIFDDSAFRQVTKVK